MHTAPVESFSSPRTLEFKNLGLADYGEVYELQKSLVDQKKKNPDQADVVLMVEHPDVYTVGRRSPVIPNLKSVYSIERGGETTYHNPGQLVIYPIIRLEGKARDLHRYLRQLEALTIELLAGFGIQGERRVGATGVWVANQQKKIASIGIAVSSWVTYHGLAINVCNDLTGFQAIQPCGFSSDIMTSMQSILGPQQKISIHAVKEKVSLHFRAQKVAGALAKGNTILKAHDPTLL